VTGSNSTTPRLARFAWAVLGYNLAVIAWGAFVRATGSGAGCGRHWPTCNGEVIPRPQRVETVIELAHRASSGVALVLVFALMVAAFVGSSRGAPVRKAAVAAFAFVCSEALVGAGLVLFELVAHDKSMKRALSMSIHLNNTFILLAALIATVHFARGGETIRVRKQGILRLPLAVALLGMMLLGTSGALAALGDTLFPSASLAAGIDQDLSAGAHFLVRLRGLHPVIAVVTALVVTATGAAARALRPGDAAVARVSRALGLAFLAQLGLGLANLLALAPVALQLAHLVLADVVWLLLVSLVLRALAARHAAPAAISPRSDPGTVPLR
jgi:heme A synthase